MASEGERRRTASPKVAIYEGGGVRRDENRRSVGFGKTDIVEAEVDAKKREEHPWAGQFVPGRGS